jgi:hypothetical protein
MRCWRVAEAQGVVTAFWQSFELAPLARMVGSRLDVTSTSVLKRD